MTPTTTQPATQPSSATHKRTQPSQTHVAAVAALVVLLAGIAREARQTGTIQTKGQ